MRNCFIIVGSALLALAAGRMAPAAGGELRAASVVRVDSRTGRLVRRVVPPAQPRAAGETFRARAGVDQLVAEAARRHNVDPLLVHSVIQVESNYNPFAVSAKGARGLMQLVPATARRFGVRNPFDPKQNIDAGVRYLKHLQDTFHDTRLALAAYNCGEGRVNGAVVRAASTVDPSVKDTAAARRIEADLSKATATLFPGGEIVLHPYDKTHRVFNTFRIRCRDDILLREKLLELSGSVNLAYEDGASGTDRTLECERLSVYFTQNPLSAGLTTWDMTAYRALVKGKDTVEPPDDANRVKRIRAQEKVTFDMGGYTGACALLEWDLLSDEIRCDGMGREIEVAYGKEFSLRGAKILVRPVNEELRVVR